MFQSSLSYLTIKNLSKNQWFVFSIRGSSLNEVSMKSGFINKKQQLNRIEKRYRLLKEKNTDQ